MDRLKRNFARLCFCHCFEKDGDFGKRIYIKLLWFFIDCQRVFEAIDSKKLFRAKIHPFKIVTRKILWKIARKDCCFV